MGTNRQPNVAVATNAILRNWRRSAGPNEGLLPTMVRHKQFLRATRSQDTVEVMELGRQLHNDVFAVMDCTKCANCCKVLKAAFTNAEIEQAARHLGITSRTMKRRYLQECHAGKYVVKTLPCPFLAADNHCTIYDARPADCVYYPVTDEWTTPSRRIVYAQESAICPAMFHVVTEARKTFRSARQHRRHS
jgi:Fe-S-cluster containining protein